LRAVLYHESLHVEQFLAEDRKPPPTYALMVMYECDAGGPDDPRDLYP
jgi:hypothetical protein